MANKKHLEILKQGVEAWNKWREENPDVSPDLSGADLREAYLFMANLSGADLHEADLQVACLDRAELSGANLGQANLIEADLHSANIKRAELSKALLSGANLSGADLSHTKLRRADLGGADLVNADLIGVDLANANLCGADLSGAIIKSAELSLALLGGAILSKTDLSGANLSGADLRGADLRGADLRGANLYKANLSQANLDHAILRYARHYVLNENSIDGTRFSPGAKDPWSVLRRSYTGPRFFIHLMLLVIFFVPLVLKTTVWTGVSKTENAMNDAVMTLDSMSQLLSDQKPQEIQEVIDSLVTKIHRYVPGTGPEWKKLWVLQLLIGWDKGVWPVILSLVILTYNLLRGFLTFRVSLLREEEERSKYSPAKSEYYRLFRMHRVVRILLAFALFSFCWNAWHWLFQDVWLPT